MKMSRYWIRAVACFLLVTDANAYEQGRAVNNLAHDYAECAAYYTLAAKGAGKSDTELVGKLSEAGSQAIEMSVGLTNKEVATARYNMALKSMMDDMSDSFDNFSIVINKYADLCRDVMDNPRDRLKYWQDRKD